MYRGAPQSHVGMSMPHKAMQETPFSLSYGVKVVIPIETKLSPSSRARTNSYT